MSAPLSPQWDATFDAIGDAVCLLSPNGRIVRCNRAALDLFDKSMDEVARRSCWKILKGRSKPRKGCPYQRARDSLRRESEVFAIDGRWYKVTVDPILDDSGELGGFVHILSDITERKRAEEALLESETRFRSLVKISSDHLFTLDTNGVYLFSNDRVGQFGLDNGRSLIGKHLRDVYPSEVAEIYLQRLEEVVSTGQPVDFEHPLTEPDGERRQHLDRLYPLVHGGKVQAVGGICRDITAWKDSEEKLRRRAEHLRTISELSIRLASLSSADDLYRRIAEELRSLTGALAASFSTYDPDNRELVIKVVAAEGGLIARANEILGQRIIGHRSPVSERMYQRMIDEVVTTASDLSETTFGTISKPVAATIQRIMGIDRFIGLAFADGDELIGTAVIVIPSGLQTPPDDVFQTFAHVAATSLRQRRAEEALRESEERYRQLIEEINEVVFSIDQAGVVTYISPAIKSITGYSAEDIVGRPFVSFIHPDDRSLARERFENIATGDEEPFEYRITTRSGEIRWARSHSQPFFSHGTFKGVRGMMTDVTERKRAERALVEREARYRAVVEHQTDLLSRFDPDGTLTFVNEAYCRYFGRERDELIGRNVASLLVDWDREQLLDYLNSFGPERRVARTDHRVIAAGGKARWVQWIDRPITDEDGSVIEYQSVGRDITERKRAEERVDQRIRELNFLSQAATELVELLEGDIYHFIGQKLEQLIPDAALVTVSSFSEESGSLCVRAMLGRGHRLKAVMKVLDGDPVGRAFKISDEARESLASGRLNKVPGGIVGLTPDLPESIARALASVLDVDDVYAIGFGWEGRLLGDVVILMRKGGELKSRSIVQTFLRQAAVALQRRQAEEALRRSEEQLRDLAEYLQTAREEERTRVAREIHDEFGQALTALKFDLSWLSKRVPEGSNGVFRKIDEMNRLLDATIQTVRRVSTELRPGLLDDLGLAAAIEWQTGHFAERTGIECHLDLDTEEILDRDLNTALFRIFQESLTNVGRHADATEVVVKLKMAPDEVVLIIRDNGRGITDSEIRDPRSLGLLGMRERVRTFDGEIVLEGTSGEGTTVTVRMPRQVRRDHSGVV